MSINSTNSYNPTIDSIVGNVMVLSGLMNPQQSISDVNHKDLAKWCRETLNDIVHELIASDVILRWTEFRTFTTTADTEDYTLGSDVIDVLGTLSYQRSSTSAWTHVSQMSDEDWNSLSAKDSTGWPTRAMVYKANDPLLIRLWPTPDTTGATIRYKAHVIPADMDEGQYQLDMPVYWRNYIKNRLAAELCKSQGLDAKSQGFRVEAKMQYERNMNKSQSKAPRQGYVPRRIRRR